MKGFIIEGNIKRDVVISFILKKKFIEEFEGWFLFWYKVNVKYGVL